MRRYLYLSTAVAGVMMTTGAGSVSAQCVTSQDCAALGYTDSACPGSGVKCPFGNSWYCGGGAAEDCTKLGFIYGCTGTGYAGGAGQTCNGKYTSCTCTSPYTWNGSACTCPSTYKYTCSGTGYAGGSGTACGGKYAACTCANGYEWKNGTCQKQVLNGAQGELYYCNGTVVGVRATGMGFYVAMQDLGEMYWDEANNQSSSFVFCNYLKGILPSSDQLMTINKNKTKLNEILATYGGTNLIIGGTYWSSTYGVSGLSHYSVSLKDNPPNMGWGSDNVNHYVRPVLASW